MVTDKDFKISPGAYLAIAGALAYVVLPIDVIPDFIPGIGFVDDMFVVGVVMKSISDEIKRYKILTQDLLNKGATTIVCYQKSSCFLADGEDL